MGNTDGLQKEIQSCLGWVVLFGIVVGIILTVIVGGIVYLIVS